MQQVSTLPPVLLLLLLISLSSSSCCHGANAAAGDHHDFMVVPASSLLHLSQGAVCSGHKDDGLTAMPPHNRAAWVPINRPHGPCSSAGAMDNMLDNMLLWDQLRTSYILGELSDSRAGKAVPTIDANATPAPPVVKQDNMMVEGNITLGPQPNVTCNATSSSMATSDAARSGKPGVRQTVVIDTSSDITWVQCLPCPVPQCHLQKDPLYDPADSSTYAPIPCASRACKELGSSYGNGCSGSGQCNYAVNYGDGRATTGTYITDTLTLSDNTTSVNGFRFGCSHADRGPFGDRTAGVLALGGGPQSLRAQAAPTYGDAFSYCIPLPSSVGFLSLGGPPVGLLPRFVLTPLIKNPRAPTFYIVRLEAITVSGKRLGVPPAAFAAGAVMDSNAIITQLPAVAYAALRAAFRSFMGAYPRAAPVLNLDTCYDFTRSPKVTLPKVSLVFAGGATVPLDAASIMLGGCLAFAAIPGNGSLGFIGNIQQQNYEVLYDVGGGSVGFRRGAC
ncbi:hypothetical protein ACQJBY_072097 [Aegilops geniculata]